MGLDISWYRNLHEPLPFDRNSGDDLDDTFYHTRTTFTDHPSFEGRIQGIDPNLSYKYDERGGFHAGSYIGYYHWRNTLAEMAGWPEKRDGNGEKTYCVDAWEGEDGPFAELINFSDCEGTIGPVVSAKLAKDFADYQEKADAEGGDFAGRYALWRNAFEQAAQNGAVDFH